MSSLKTELLIVGAGPSGLALAAQCLRYGIDFVILDAKEGVTKLSKALVVQARTLEIYQQLGLADRAVAAGEKIKQGTFLHRGRIAARIRFGDFGAGLSPFPFVLVFEQSKNEELLHDYLRAHGRQVHWQTELAGISQNSESVKATAKSADGARLTIEARYLAGCDGAHSPTRHAIGLEFEGSTDPRVFYVADVEMDFEAERQSLYAAFLQRSFVLLFPMQGDRHWRLIGNLPDHDPNSAEEPNYEEVEARVKEQVQRPLGITKVEWFSSYKVHTRHARQFQDGRCFLVGDSAHVHTPAGGQGMNTGIQDAYNLGWKLALVLKGIAGPRLLETYNEERLANAKRLLRTTDRFFEILAGQNRLSQFLRDKVMPLVMPLVAKLDLMKKFVFPTVSEIAITYREHSLSEHNGDKNFTVKAGDRMPYFRIGNESVFDRLTAPKFHFLIFSNAADTQTALPELLDPALSDWVDFTFLPLSAEVKTIFGAEKPFQVFLRPDNHVALVNEGESIAPVAAWLAQKLL